MDDLIAFVTARLDEDEAMVAEPHIWPTTFRPERVLREVEAVRAIIKLCEDAFDGRFDDDPWNSGYDRAMEGALGSFAATWSDHPDYRQEWKP